MYKIGKLVGLSDVGPDLTDPSMKALSELRLL